MNDFCFRCGTNYESADEALESAATNVNVNSQWAVDAKTTRGCKRDVYKVVRGPGIEGHRDGQRLLSVSGEPQKRLLFYLNQIE